LLALGSRLYK